MLIRRIALVLSLLAPGCTDATGNVQGGEPLIETSTLSGPPTWTALYKDYFGPSGQASCTALTSCHGAASQSGSQISGFVCGPSKDECWQGMTTDAGVFPAIVMGSADPTKTTFYKSLHQDPSSTDNALCSKPTVVSSCNMPCGDSPNCHTTTGTYTFTADDLARISTWIQQGAQDN